MKRKASSQLEPNMSPEGSQDMFDPQLRQPTTRVSAPSTREGEHTTSGAADRSIGNPISSSEHEESEFDDEDWATVQDFAEDDQHPLQAYASGIDHEDATTGQDFDEDEDDQHAPQGVYAAAPKMAGVGRLATMHGDQGHLHAGFLSYMRSRRTLIIDNDDHQELLTWNTVHVRQVYNAITTNPASMTDYQTRMVALWGKKLDALGNNADQYMADLASMVIAGVYALHTGGDHVFDAQFEGLKPHDDDSTMKATDRVETVCDILHNNKKHVIDIMAGFDAITKFVAAPKGIAKRKEDYKSNNDMKKAKLTQLEGVAKAAGKEVDRKKVGRKPGRKSGKKADKKGGKKGGKNDDEYEDEDDV